MLEAKQQHITGHTRAESQRGPAALFRPCHLVCLLLLCVAIQIKRNRKGPCAAALRKQGYVILFPMQPQSPLTLEPFKCSLMADSALPVVYQKKMSEQKSYKARFKLCRKASHYLWGTYWEFDSKSVTPTTWKLQCLLPLPQAGAARYAVRLPPQQCSQGPPEGSRRQLEPVASLTLFSQT